jgi:hypothetical protein
MATNTEIGYKMVIDAIKAGRSRECALYHPEAFGAFWHAFKDGELDPAFVRQLGEDFGDDYEIKVADDEIQDAYDGDREPPFKVLELTRASGGTLRFVVRRKMPCIEPIMRLRISGGGF